MHSNFSRLFAAGLSFVAFSVVAATTSKAITWNLPDTWEDGVTYDEVEKVGGGGQRYIDIYGGDLSRRYGLGGVGEPDLPTLTFNVGIPDGGSFVSADVSATEWTPVEANGAIPIPIAEPVQYGAELVYPTPEKGAYEGLYPSKFLVVGNAAVGGGVTMMPITVTPYKWDGAAKTLYKASKFEVKIALTVKKTLRLTTSSTSSAKSNPNSAKNRALARTINPGDLSDAGGLRLTTSSATASADNLGQIIIISPSAFVPLWEGYAAFRKSTEAGKNFEYIIKNTADIYNDPTYWTEQCEKTRDKDFAGNGDALAIHHYLEEMYNPEKEQYIILGAAPTKYQYDRATMVPARYVVNQGALDHPCDMYYGCMDRINAQRQIVHDDSAEVWDCGLDGVYMGYKNAGGGYSGDNDKCVDWQMDVPVTRVPLMREVAEKKNGHVYHMNAAQIMDNFTNRIAFAESPETWTSEKSWRHVLGGGYLSSEYPRGTKHYHTNGERRFFDGGVNYFDLAHPSPAKDSEGYPRIRNFEYYSNFRAARRALINTGSYKNTNWADLYTNFGDTFVVYCHGWAGGADPGTREGALYATGLWRVFNMAVPCDSGMYDYCPGGSYGITNCVCMGEAPHLCFGGTPDNPRNVGGGLVTFNNTRYGWGGGLNGMSARMELLIDQGFYEKDMNAGQVIVWAHNQSGMFATGNRNGASNLEVVMHGDPLIKISPQFDRALTFVDTEWTTDTVDYTKNLSVDVAGGDDEVTFNVANDDLAAARMTLEGNEGQTITLGGPGLFRTTDFTKVNNADLVWNVAGGAGRNGIEFVGRRGNLTFEGNAKRYVGFKVLNAESVEVNGGNVIFDFNDGRTAAQDFTVNRFAFGGNSLDPSAYNVIRARKEAFFDASRTIPVVNNCLELQTWNIGGGDATMKDKPLFFLTNSYLKVTYNPYWDTEYFVRPTHLTDSHIVGEYEKFGFGRPGSDGYDLYVWGKSSITGDVPIKVTGELRIHLMDANAELEIANALSDGHSGAAGLLRVMGLGKVRITKTQTFTGGITVENGAKLDFALAKAVKCDVTVENGGELHLGAIPLDGVKTITLKNGSRTYLVQQTGTGIYQMVDSSTSSVIREPGSKLYDASAPTTELTGIVNDGSFILSDGLISWTGLLGTWKNDSALTDNWRDSLGAATGFSNAMPVRFGEQAGPVSVTVEGDVKPGFVVLDNATTPYTFGGTGSLFLESLSSSCTTTFDAGLNVNSIFKVLGGLATAGSITTPLVDISGGGKLHVTDAVTEPPHQIKALKFSFSASMSSELCAVQELRLFRDGAFVRLPVGTVITDIAKQTVTITGSKGDYGHTMTGNTGNEDLGALVDGTTSGNNKWWASKSSAPTWFIITFPTPIDPIDGYSLCTADAGQKNRNPKTWNVSASLDGEVFSQVSAVADFQSTKSSYWLGSGDGTKANFDIVSVEGALTVRDGGTLYADGKLALNLVLEAGATLAVTNNCHLTNTVSAAGLTLPDGDGSVLVDASQAVVTDQAFPVLCGYELTPEQFRKFCCVNDQAALNLKNGDLYIVTDGIKKAPYTATVSEWAGTLGWSTLDWVDGGTNHFTWTDAINYRTDGDATIDLDWVDGQATTLDLDMGGALGSLTLRGRAADPIALRWGAALVPRLLDFSGYAGPVTLDYGANSIYALADADFIAGTDSLIPSASSGSLSIGANKRAIIPDWGDWTKVTGAGTIAIKKPNKGDIVTATWGNTIGVTGTLELLCGTWEVVNTTDYPKNKEIKIGANGVLKLTTVNDTTGFGTYTTGLTIADGGEVQVAKRDTFNRVMTLHNGGKLTFTRDVSDNNRVFDFFNNAGVRVTGTTPSMIGGSAAEIDAETMDPIVKSGIISIRRPSNFTVDVAEGSLLNVFAQWGGGAGTTYPWIKTGDGVMAFYRVSEQSGKMTIEDGAVRLVNKGQGTTGSIDNNAELQVAASNNYVQTVANVIQGTGGVTKLGPGTTVLSGVNLYSGDTTVEEGTLKIGNADALGASSVTMKGGVLDMGAFRIQDYTVNAALDAALGRQFKIRAELTAAESLGQVQLVKLGAFAEYLTSGELKQLFAIVVNGSELDPEEFKIVVSGGIAEYQPDQLAGYNYPLETTVATSNDWAAFEWRDQSHVAFTDDWTDYPNATAVVNVEPGKNGQMTFAHSVTTPRLTINNKGGCLEIGGGAGTFRATGMIDAMGCEEGSVTFLNFDLGACNIDTGAGEVILLPGCTGTLNTEPGSIVTITNGTGRGTAVLAAGSELRFLGTEPMNNLLWSSVDNRSGAWIGYGFPITTDEVAFGGVGDSPTRTDGNFHFQGNLDLQTTRFVAGNGKDSVQQFRQTGGRIAVSGTGDGATTDGSAVLIAHWPSAVTYEMTDGEFVAENSPMVLGWDGKAGWTMSGGRARFKGILATRPSDSDNTSSFALSGGVLEIGAQGIDFTNRGDRNASFAFGGGTLRAYASATVAVEKGIPISGNATIAADESVLLTVSAPISGDGVLTAEGPGTVRYTGDCSAAKLAGKFEIGISEAQRMGSTSTVLFTLPDGVTVPDVRVVDVNGDTATGGNGAAANGKYHWVPSGTYIQPITTTLNGGEMKSYETTWYDAAGKEIAFANLTSAMDLVADVTADTTLVSYDTKSFGKMTFTGGHTLTLKSVFTGTTIATAEVLTDVILADNSFKFEKVTALPEGTSLTVNSADSIDSFGDGPFAGTLVCNGFLPTWQLFTFGSRWNGTLVLKGDQTLKGEDKFFASYGNANSTVELDGTFDGYLKQAGSTETGIRVTGTLKFSNGYSSNGGYLFGGALSGTGLIQTSGSPTDVLAFTGDAAQFRGTVDVKGGHCVSFGAQADDGSCEGKISVLSTSAVIAADKTWGAQNGIVVQNGGVLSVEYRNGTEWAAGTSVTVKSGGTLNLVRTDDAQREFKVSNTALTLNGKLTLNGIPVPSWGFSQNAGTITLKEKAVCVLPVKANVSGRQNLTALTFTDSAETPNTFEPNELLSVADLEIDFTMADGAELVVDNTLGASAFRFLGTTATAYVIGSTGATTVYAGTDTVFDTAANGTLVIESGMKATVPSWTGTRDLQPGGWLKLTGSGDVVLKNYTVAGATLELAGSHTLATDSSRAVADSTLVSAGTLTTGSHENGMKPGSTLRVTDGTMTLNHRFIMSQGSAGTAYLEQTGGEIASGANSGNIYVGGYDNSRMVAKITGGRFSAAYAPYVDNGVTKCYGTTTVADEGVFAPRIITLCTLSCALTEVTDVTVSTYNHNLYLADGGTFEPPAIIPNWFAMSVTNGTAKLAPQGDGTTLAKGPITIAKDCTLDVAGGTLKLTNAPQGEGTLDVSEGATLDVNGINVSDVSGEGTVTNSSATAAYVIYKGVFETNLTFNCDVKLENPYVDVAETASKIVLIAKGSGIIASMDGVRVRVNGKLDRRTWKLAEDRKGIEVSVPYAAFLTKTTNWDDGDGEGLVGHEKFQDDKNYSIVISNAADEATLTFDTDARASVFKLVSDFDKTATIAKNDATILDFGAYDFSEAHGRATLAFNPGSVSVTAGSDSHFTTGGSGKLTIPVGTTAAVGAEFASYDNEGTLRRDYDCGEQDYGTILTGGASSTNSFKSVTLKGGMQAAKVVIQVLDGDRVTLKGTAGNYGGRTKSSFDVRGGKLLLESNQSDTWYGENGTTAFTQSGGIFEVTANNPSQSGNVGFMFGYANTSLLVIPFDISGGAFLVEDTSINFYDPSVVALRGTGLMRAKGVFKAKSTATMTIADEARFELGSLGWRENSADLTMNGGMLTTFENATMANAITLGDNATIGAAADTTLTLNATVSGAHTLTIGAAASNDTGVVKADGSRFQCGAITIAAGTLEMPVESTLTNDVTIAEAGKINLTGLEGAAEYVVTSGKLTGATDANITFNGLALAAAKLELDAANGKLVSTVAVQPFRLDITDATDTSWTNAHWMGANDVPVTPDQWSRVCVATVSVADGIAAELTVDSPIQVEQLKISNKGSLNVRLADPDFSILEVDNLDSSANAVFTVVGQDGEAWPVSKFGFGTNRIEVACGTRMSPFTIDTKEKLLESRDIRIAEGAALRMHELASGSGNSVWTIAGKGWDKSTLILSVERGLGFNAGSNFTNLTLVVDAAVADKKVYFEQRSEQEVLTDSTVDLVITNASEVVVQGSSTFGNTLNIGNLSGDGMISGGSYNNAALGVNLHDDSTFDGVCKIPMIVSGGHTLTLTHVNTGAITVTNGATVKLALVDDDTHTAALAGDGTVEVAAGTLRTTGDLPCKLVIDAEGKLDIVHDLADEFTLSTQRIVFGEGASVTNNITANGVPLAGNWTIDGGTIRRAPATQPFALAPTFDSDWTAAGWRDAYGEDVVSHDWSKTVTNATATVGAGTNVTLTLDRGLAITTFEVSGEGLLAIANPGCSFAASSVVITDGATLALPACTAGTISGTGTLVLRAANRDTAVSVSGAFDTTKFTGPIRLDCGTWNIKDNYPTWFALSAVGKNAVLQFNKQDLTGYNQNFPDLVIADGATLKISKRDTFDRKLVLRNGARMVLDADDLNSGRAFDFFEKSSLKVGGGAVSTIGGITPETTSASGIICLRRNDFEMTVDAEATLDVWAQWGKDACPWKKLGAGKVIFRRASGTSGKLSIDGGTVQLIDGGQGTTGEMAFASGTKLELNATGENEKTLVNPVSGEGRIEKLGTGTYKLTAANTFTGGTTVSGGKLVVGNSSAIGTAGVIVKNGAALRFVDATTIANAVTLEMGAKMDLFSAAEDPAEIVLPTGAVTLPAEAKVTDFFTVNGGPLPAGNWVLEGGKLVNKDIRVVHFTANVTNDVTWSTAAGLADTNDVWNSTASSTAILTNDLTSVVTVTFDQDITADTFTLVGSGATTFVLGAEKQAAIREFVAGGDTRFTFDSEGALTVPAGMKATLNDGVEFAKYANKGGTIRFERDESAGLDFATLVPYGTGTYEFRKAQFTGSLQHGGAYVLGVREGDDIVLNGNTGSRSTLSFDITGGRVAIADAEDTWFGDNSSTRFTMSGGEFVVGAHSTATTGTKGFLLGYTGGSSKPLTLDVSGGIFAVTNTFLNFYNPTVINLTGGILRAKGIRQSGNAGTINVGTGASLEIGAYGIPANSATLNLDGGMLRGYETTTVANAINLAADSTVAAAPGMTLTISGTISGNGDLTLGTAEDTGTVNFKIDGATGEETRYKIINGNLTIAPGAKVAVNGMVKEGWIAQGGYLTPPVEAISINVIGGNANRGGKSITSGFAGVAPVFYGNWNQFLNRTDGSSFNVLEEMVNELMKDGSLSSGLIKATLSGACAYTCGQNGTTPNGQLLFGYIDDGGYSGRGAGIVVENIPYTEYTVYIYFGSDSNGGENGYGPVKVNDVWYPAASTGWGNRAQSRTADPTLQENVNYRAVGNLTTRTLTIYGSTSGKPSGTRCGIAGIQIVNTGSRIVHEDLWWNNADNCWTNTIGEVREETESTILNARDGDGIDYAPTQSQGVFVLPESGALTIAGHTNLGTRTLSLPADLTVTLDGTGLPTANFVGTGTLRFAGTYDAVPYLADTSTPQYNVCFAGTIANGGDMFLGNAKKTLFFGEGCDITANRLVLGNQAGTVQHLTQTGGRITLNRTGNATSNTDTPLLLSHWKGDDRYLKITGGEMYATNGIVRLGWDGGVLLQVGGGDATALMRAKGIRGGSERTDKGTFELDVQTNGVLEVGASGISMLNSNLAVLKLSGGTIRAYANATVDCGTGLAVAPGSTLAADEGVTLTVASAISGVENLTLDGAGTVVLVNYRGSVAFAEESTAKVGFVVDINDCGEFTPPSGVDPERVELYKADGTTQIATTVVGGKLTYEWEVDGKVCWWDYEFDGNVTSVGTDTTTMSPEGTEPYYNDTENPTALWVGHATHYRGASYPEEFTAVLYGKMVNNEKHVEIGFGSTTAGTKVNVAIACGNPANDEVKLLVSEGFTVKKTVLMSVPNAYTADHLYAFVYKTVTENGVEKSKVIVYLDGVEWDSYTFDSKVTLGGGFQIGSVHGGAPTGYAKATTANSNSFLDFLRVYKTVLSAEAMTKYAEKYLYTSENGSSVRTFEGDGDWAVDAGKPWNVTLFDKTHYETNVALAGSVVRIGASEDSTITMNLDASTSYEALEFKDGASITLATGEGAVTPTVSGLTKVGTNVTNAYDAVSFGKIDVAVGKALVFDFTDFPFTNYYDSTTIEFTGAVSGEGTVKAAGLPTEGARTAAFVKNASNHYELRITVGPLPFVYTIAQGGTGSWTWDGQGVSEEIVNANPSIPIQKDGTGTLEKAFVDNRSYIVNEGLFKATNAKDIHADVTVNASGVFDFNGAKDGYVAVYLNGGSLVNNGGEMGFGKRQIEGIALSADSTVGGTGLFGMSSSGHAANVLDLGGSTLSKTDANTFFLCNTTVTNGLVNVTGGTLEVAGTANGEYAKFVDAGLTLGAGTALKVDANKSLTIAAITASEATIDNAGTISGFELTGSATLTGAGIFGTITNAVGAVADVGTRHDLTFAGAGSVKAQLASYWKPGDTVTLFGLAEGATTSLAELRDQNGNVIAPSRYTVANGVVTFKHGVIFMIR